MHSGMTNDECLRKIRADIVHKDNNHSLKLVHS